MSGETGFLGASNQIRHRENRTTAGEVDAGAALSVVLLPLILILGGAVFGGGATAMGWVRLVTHPFTALAIGLLAATAVLTVHAGGARRELAQVCNRGLDNDRIENR